MISDVKLSLLKFAQNIDNYESISNEELAIKYLELKYTNDIEASNYYAAIVIKNWVIVLKLKASCFFIQDLDIQTCYDWLIDAINYTLKYDKRRDSSSELYHQFDRMLNMNVSWVRKAYLENYYGNSNKLNTLSLSLNELKDDIGFEPGCKDIDMKDIYTIINNYIFNDEYIKAIIVDKIVYSDVYTYDLKHNLHFSSNLFYDQLYELDDRYINYFYNKYNRVNQESLKLIRKDFRLKKRRTFSMYIKKYIEEIKKDLGEGKYE